VVLVGLDWVRPKDPPVSLAVASLAAAVRAAVPTAATTTETVASNGRDPVEVALAQVVQQLSGATRALVGLSAFVWNARQVGAVTAALARLGRHAPAVVVGGPEITYAPVGTDLEQEYPGAAAFVRGFGEHALCDIVQHGLRGGRGVRLAGAPDDGSKSVTDAAALTSSPLLSGELPSDRFARWETARGCPFTCAFCQHRSADGVPRAQLPDARVFAEAARLAHCPDLAVVDPVFNSELPLARGAPVRSTTRPIAVLNALRVGGFRGHLSLQCRAEMVRPDFVDAVAALRDAGATPVLEFGIQSVVAAELAHVDRTFNARRVEDALALVRAAQLPFELSFIYGLPQQTPASWARSLDWGAAQCLRGRGTLRAWPLMLLRGTPLHARAAELGLVASDAIGVDLASRVGSGIPHVVQSPTFSPADWLRMHDRARATERATEHAAE
jgi:hypothetical protein